MRLKPFLVAVALISGCASAPISDPLAERYNGLWNAYVAYLNAEIAGGRMSEERGRYLALQKKHELEAEWGRELAARERANAAEAAALLGAGVALQGMSQPRVLGSGSLPMVDCFSRPTPSGVVTQCR